MAKTGHGRCSRNNSGAKEAVANTLSLYRADLPSRALGGGQPRRRSALVGRDSALSVTDLMGHHEKDRQSRHGRTNGDPWADIGIRIAC